MISKSEERRKGGPGGQEKVQSQQIMSLWHTPAVLAAQALPKVIFVFNMISGHSLVGLEIFKPCRRQDLPLLVLDQAIKA